MRLFFACMLACAACATWFEAPLSWDGAYYLFKLLDDGVPFTPLSRWSNVPLQAPVLLARHAGVEDLRILRPLFALPYALIPVASLALSWWIVRERRPGLFVWPVLSIALSNLPGIFFMVSEGPIAIELFWPIVLALLVGGVTRAQLAALAAAGALAALAHPIAAPLSAACGLLAALLAWQGRLGPRGRGFLVAAAFAALAAARALAPLTDYESRNLSVRSFADPFRAATWGWPRVSLAATLAAALVAWLQPWLLARSRRAGVRTLLAAAPAVLALAAGLAMIPWARSESRWASALNYRFVMNALSAGFLVAATLEGLRVRRAPVGAGADLLRARGPAVVAAAVSLLVLFAVQGASWSALRERFARDLAAGGGPCVPLSALPSVPRTALTHWSSTPLSIVLQGRRPARIATTGEGCEELARTAAVRIAPWDLRAREGWFRLPR
jgi:hypothetical protein